MHHQVKITRLLIFLLPARDRDLTERYHQSSREGSMVDGGVIWALKHWIICCHTDLENWHWANRCRAVSGCCWHRVQIGV